MTDAHNRTRPMVEAGTVPVIPRHIKLRHDPGRGRWIILAPERVFNPKYERKVLPPNLYVKKVY